MGYIHDDQTKHYIELLREILDTLEGGDVSLDFENMPSAATTIRIISDIVGNALRGITAIEEIAIAMNKAFIENANGVKK